MMSGDGVWCRCHPIYAVFVGDYPEQVLVTCTYGNWCPKCLVPADELGSNTRFPLCNYKLARDVYLLADGDACAFHLACREISQKPVFHPFWEKLPFTNVFVSITPDILHQLLQGVFKHLVSWLIGTFGTLEIDACCRSIPPNHHILTFAKGISILTHVTGKEHKNMSRILLGLVLDLPVPNGQVSPCIAAATCALLDFLYLAQLPSHSPDTLMLMEDSLTRFHNNKEVFVDLGIRNHFNISKIHSLNHYDESIRLFGCNDNYNTEQTERLHIDTTKNAYLATNHKDEYYQMTSWVNCREKVQHHLSFIKWRQRANGDAITLVKPIGPPCPSARSLRMAQNATLKAVLFDTRAQKYGAIDFQDALVDFIAQMNHPTASGAVLSALASDTLLPFCLVPVHHQIKFSILDGSEIVDSILVQPEQKDTRGRPVPPQFDTVLIHGKSRSQDKLVPGVEGKFTNIQLLFQSNPSQGHCIVQVRVVFEIPDKVIQQVFTSPETIPPQHLAYVEWFSPIPMTHGSNHQMHQVTRLRNNGQQRASIIPIDSILCSVHLLPVFGPQKPQAWNTFNVLELCNSFYVNPFSDRDNYLVLS